MEGKYSLALSEINKAFAMEPTPGTRVYRVNFIRRAQIHFYSGNLNAAGEDFWGLYKQKEPQAIYVGSMGLVNLDIMLGKFGGIKDILTPYIDLSKKYAVY